MQQVVALRADWSAPPMLIFDPSGLIRVGRAYVLLIEAADVLLASETALGTAGDVTRVHL